MRKLGGGLIAAGSILAIALGVALALPDLKLSERPSSHERIETTTDNATPDLQMDRDASADDLGDSEGAAESNSEEVRCTDENGEPLPTVSNPCMADATSDRALALTCEATSSDQNASAPDKRWFEENCVK